MRIFILTLFPHMFSGPFDFSIIKRAQEKKIVEIEFINIRDFAIDNYKTVDDKPYGGGVGMIMRVDVIDRALTFVKKKVGDAKTYTILLDPKGETFTQEIAQNFAKQQVLVFICGHYEGVDARVETLVDTIISIGNFVLTGGEIPTAAIVDSVVRLIPNVLSQQIATADESFTDNYLEYPQYTRPADFKGLKVPETLLSGNHAKISQWKRDKRKGTKLKA